MSRATLPVVYIVQADRFVKIGHALDAEIRVRALQIGSPFKITLLFTITPFDRKTATLERELHDRFSPYRSSGEWFEIRGDLLDWLVEHST